MALEAQKCLWRLLRIRHPGDEARLDALERAVLLEAGVRLVRDRPLDKYEKVRQLRERLGCRLTGAWVRAEARQVQLVGWWQRRRRQQQMECEEEQALAREAAQVDSDDGHSESVTPAALSRCSSSLSLSRAASTPASIALDRLAMHSEAGDWDLLSAVSPLTSCDGSLDERSEGGMSSERRRKEAPAARAAMLDPVRMQLSFDDDADPHPADPHMHTLVLGDERAMLEDPHTHLRPLLFLHGHSMSSVFFRHLFRDLVHNNRYVVYAVDLLGWGRSSRPPFDELGERSGRRCRRPDREHQVELAISFMVDALDAFLQHSGITPWCRRNATSFDIVAHSLGAYTAAQYVAARPQAPVRNLILVTPAGVTARQSYIRALYFKTTPQLVARRAGLLGYLLFLIKWPRRDRGFQSRLLQQYTYGMATRAGNRSGDAAFSTLVRVSHRQRQATCLRPLAGVDGLLRRLPRCVRGEIRIIAGERDPLIPVQDMHLALREMQMSGHAKARASLHVLPQCGHVPFVEDPVAFLAASGLLEKQGAEGEALAS